RQHVALAQVSWLDSNRMQMDEFLNECSPSLRGWEWFSLKRFQPRPENLLPAHKTMTWQVQYSPDGTWLASGGEDGKIKFWKAASRKLVRTINDHPQAVLGLAISPDGAFVASGSQDGTVKIWDACTGTQKQVLTDLGSTVQKLAYSPDGKYLAI